MPDRNLRLKCLFLLVCCCLYLLPITAQATSADQASYQAWLLTINVNAVTREGFSLVLDDQQDELWMAAEDLTRFGLIQLEKYPHVRYQGKVYYKLHGLPGVTYVFDRANLNLQITVPTTLLKNQNLSQNTFVPNVVDAPKHLGGFLNYDTSFQTASNTNQAGGLFSAGFFNQFGVGLHNFLVQNTSEQGTEYVRLNSTWQYDFTEKMRSLRLGDSYTKATPWSQAVGFGGIQWGTNFSTQPNFVTFPLPSINGASVLPSSLDLLVNNTQLNSQNVDPGPFNVENIPVVTGAGTVSAVTTDFLGRQQVISIPYYASSSILKKGLADFSYELGFVRDNYGTESYDYSKMAAVATHALGISDNFTRQWHAELLTDQQTGGIGGSYIVSTFGVLSGAVAMSHANDAGPGGLASIGFQRQYDVGLSFGTNIQASTSAFTELGYDPHTYPRIQSQSYLGYPVFDGASASVSYTLQDNRNETGTASLVSIGYSQTLIWGWNLSLSAITDAGGDVDSQSLFMTLSRSVAENTNLNVGGILQSDGNQGSFQLSKSLTEGPSYGYNIQANPGENSTYQAAVSAQNKVGTYTVTAAQQNGENGLRFEAGGAISSIMGGGVHFSPEINNSFAIVSTGIPNVNIYNYNQIIATTDAAGNALLPNLNAYQANPISLDPNELPMNAEIMASKVNVIPYYRSGKLIRFPVSLVRSAQMRLLLPSGASVPAGAMVHIVGKEATLFAVGANGDFYVAGLSEKNTLIANWNDNSCQFILHYPKTKAMIPQLGDITCEPN